MDAVTSFPEFRGQMVPDILGRERDYGSKKLRELPGLGEKSEEKIAKLYQVAQLISPDRYDQARNAVNDYFERQQWQKEFDAEAALAAFNDETRYWINNTILVSMSGGFDSRVIGI